MRNRSVVWLLVVIVLVVAAAFLIGTSAIANQEKGVYKGATWVAANEKGARAA